MLSKNAFIQPVFCLLLFSLSCQNGTRQGVLEPEKFKEKMEQPGVVVVDVRSPDEFSAGHIAGALNRDVNGSHFGEEVSRLDTSKTYLLYCRSGKRAHQAAEEMRRAGFRKTYEMKGGYPDWEAAGYPVEK